MPWLKTSGTTPPFRPQPSWRAHRQLRYTYPLPLQCNMKHSEIIRQCSSHVVLILTQRQAEFVRWGILRKTGKHYKSSYVTSRGHCSGGNFQNTAQNQNCWKHPQSRLSLGSITVWKSDYTVSYTDSLERASSRDTFQSVSHSCTHSGSCLASSWYQTTDNPSQLTLLLKPQPKFATPLLSESFQDIFSYKIKKKMIKKAKRRH